MKKISLFIIFICFTCSLLGSPIYKLRLFTSGCANGNVGNYTLDGSVSGTFPFAFALGLEHEKIKQNKAPKGWGLRIVVPPKLEAIKATYEDSKKNFGMQFNLSLYRYYKGMIQLSQQSAAYIKFKFGTGLSYIIHLGLGGGLEIYDRFTLEAEYNYHLTTILLAGIYTGYLGINLGYSF